ncbi:PREDICTED: uncharacterized protein LOC104707605 [Camelina sativa]|uniref:Uncharacterized protein LOC104707605 n=1 Tax=Camelina sativa TaxID=90675 RepID=A0ABM0T831_CAMSA|nr:PREDICTED: uncharacterized protein LOC104707605 [Camelina sativa]
MSLLARNFGKALKRVERNNNRDTRRWSNTEGDKPGGRSSKPDADYSGKRKEIQCYECGGYGHIKPVTKRNELKCLECKGMGHTKFECPNKTKSKEKSLLSFSDSESAEEGEELLNFVAFTVSGDNVPIGAESDSESDEEINPKEEYKILYDSWVQLSKDKLKLIQEKLTLESKLETAYEDATKKVNHTPLKANDQTTEGLLQKLSNLQEEYYKEKGRATVLEKELNKKHKHIRMLNSGTKDLDKILSMGRIDATHRGLGYQGNTGTSSDMTVQPVKFVSANHLEKEAGIFTNLKKEISVIKKSEERQNHPLKDHHRRVIRRRTYGCDHCGDNHQRKHCYSFRKKINLLWNLNKCYLEPGKFCSVWISKKDLYSDLLTERSNFNLIKMHEEDDEIYISCNLKAFTAVSGEDTTENISLRCNLSLIQLGEDDEEANVAYTSTGSSEVNSWYFDSGCSRHMTGDQSALDEFTPILGGKVTFGDGGKGQIEGKGVIDRSNQPKLANVYFFDGFRANLISISQLCDDGLKVTFTKTECGAYDENGNKVLAGVRSGNNCYMWKDLEMCLSATVSKLDLWHRRLGHINTQSLVKIVKANVVRGIPKLDGKSDAVCDACSKGKQIKVTTQENR